MSEAPSKKSIKRKLLKWLLGIILALVLLPFIILLILQLPPVQNFVKNKAQNYLHKQLGTEVSIKSLRFKWWNELSLKGLYVEDKTRTPLVASGSLDVEYNLLALMRNKVIISSLDWNELDVNIYRPKTDSNFNYQFIIDAFSSGQATPPDTLVDESSTTIDFEIGNVHLNKFNLKYNDSLGGMLLSASWHGIELIPGKLNPGKNSYHVRELNIDSLHVAFQQDYIPSPSEPEPGAGDTGTAFLLAVDKFNLTHSKWLYKDEASGLSTSGNTDRIAIENARFDLLKTLIDADILTIAKTRVQLSMDTAAAPPPADTSVSSPNTWVVQANKIDVDSLYFQMDDETAPRLAKGIDYMHLGIYPLVLNASDVYYSNDSSSVNIGHTYLIEKSGLQLKEMKGNVVYTSKGASLKKFVLQTAGSKLDVDIDLGVPGWENISDQLGQLQIKANIRPSILAVNEAGYFVPDLANDTSMENIMQKRLSLQGYLVGSMANLIIPKFIARDQDGTLIDLSGSATNITSTDKLGFDFSRIKLQGNKQSIASWLPGNTLPGNVELPQNMLLTGSIKGGVQRLHPNLMFQSSFGNIGISGDVIDFTDTANLSYDLQLRTENLYLGKFIRDTTIGILNSEVTAKGKGTDPYHANLNSLVDIHQFTYNNYTYNDIHLEAELLEAQYKALGYVKDSSLKLQLHATGKVDTLHPGIDASVDIDKFDLYNTHFMTRPFILKSCLAAHIDNLQPRNLDASVIVDKIQFVDNDQLYVLDSIILTAGKEDDLQTVRLRSPFGYLSAQGDYNYQTFASSLQELINRQLMAPSLVQAYQPSERQWLQFDGTFSIPKSLRKWLPGIVMAQPLTLNGRFDTDSASLRTNIFLPAFQYDEFVIDTIRAHIDADTNALHANLNLARLQHPQFPLERTSVIARAQQGKLDWHLVLDDHKLQPKYRFGGILEYLQKDSLMFSLQDSLLLNYQTWSTVGENRVLIGDSGLVFADLGMSHGAQMIQIKTEDKKPGELLPGIIVQLKEFNLASLTSLIEKDTALVGGFATGKVQITNLDTNPLLDADVKIDSVKVMGTGVGNLALSATTPEVNQYRINAHISGNDNDITLFGTYGDQLDFELLLDKLNMKTVEPFTFGALTEMDGIANGKLEIKGTTDDPDITGQLYFKNVQSRVTMINSLFRLPGEELTFTQRGLEFKNFVVTDSARNEAVINGQILTRNMDNFIFRLDVTARNMMVLGPKVNKDQWYYGPAYIDADAQIRGSSNLPRITMNVKLREKSQVTVTVPEDDPGIANREGVVQFIDMDSPIDSSLLSAQDTLSLTNTHMSGFSFLGDIEVDPQSTMRIVIDPSNGDYLEVKGTATLNLSMDPSGKMSLTGRYEIDQGKYAMSLSQLIKREFDIQKGSTIIWNGDPLSADVNITARYSTAAPAIDLIGDQLTDGNTNRNMYNQKVPVYVYLKITGELLKPDIGFELDMPEKDQNIFGGAVITRLRQINQVESDLNKQVMGLLVLNRFISDNPFDALSSGGGSVEDVARKSVSKILSQQLNNLAGSLIKGVDINFDLESQEDYTSGSKTERTDLNVDVSKRLFSDRLTVSVGSNIPLSGSGAQQNASNIIGDVTVEYTLTKDGRYRVRAYRRNLTDVILEGQNIETGVSFILVMDYDEFREILHRKKIRTEQKLRNNEN